MPSSTIIWFSILDFQQSESGLSTNDNLVCVLSSSGDIDSCRTRLGIENPTHFFDLHLLESEHMLAWPHESPVIEVGPGQDRTGLDYLPCYLREHWLSKLKPLIARTRTAFGLASELSTLQILDLHDRPALVRKDFCSMPDFRTLVVKELASKLSHRQTNGDFVLSDVNIELDPDVGSFDLIKELLLRCCFFQCGSHQEIQVEGEVKEDKVYLIRRESRADGAVSNLLVKFDYPFMILREAEHHIWLNRCLLERPQSHPLSHRVYIIKDKIANLGDLLGLITSHPVDDLANSPNRLKLLEHIKQPPERWDCNVVESGLRGVLEVFARAAEGSLLIEDWGEAAVPWKAQVEKKTVNELFFDFFRLLPGFTLSLTLSDIDLLDDILIRPKEMDDSCPISVFRCAVRRVRPHQTLEGDPKLQIELEPVEKAPRLGILVDVERNSTNWPRRLASKKLLQETHIYVHGETLKRTEPLLQRSIERLSTCFFGKIPRAVLESSPEFEIYSRRIVNPIPYLQSLFGAIRSGEPANGRFPIGSMRFHSLFTGIHCDLHLENILVPDPQHGEFAVIDLASMRRGPLDYDFVRVELAVLLDVLVGILGVRFPKDEGDIAKLMQLIDAFWDKGNEPKELATLLGLIKKIRSFRHEFFNEIKTSSGRRLGRTWHQEDKGSYYTAYLFEFLSEMLRRSRDGSTSAVLVAFLGASQSFAELLAIEGGTAHELHDTMARR